MATLSLKISLEGGKVVKTIQFDPSTSVYDACRIIREKILEANANDPKEYGLFLASEEDNKKGIWLEASRSLDYYMLRNGDLLEYNKKTRNLRVRMLDGTVKTLLVDDSQIVANLMVVICTKIGITNYDEYGLVREEQKEEADPCEKPNYGTLTLKRRHQEKERDSKMDQLRKKLRTDDEVNWVEPSKTLREQGVEATETLLLRRRLFFSDRNVDSRDPVQLNLLYVQARDAILAGTHPITQDKACEFAGIQCQIQFGDHKEDKHTPGFLDLKEFLPASYVKVKGIEKKVFKEHRKHAGLSELDAKVLYTKSARDLKTYGVAFFLVKEKMKGKNKLVPRLLGVTKDSVLRLDEKTKEILQTWPLTTVRRWCASPNTFTLDFGDYSDQYYSVQTTEAEQILQVIAGYIDIIVRKRRARDHLGIEGDEGSAMLEDSVSPSKANIIQHDTLKASGKVNTTSVAKPAVLRPGAEGAKPFAVGHVTGAQQTTVSGQVLTGHAPPAATQVQQTKVTSVLTEPQRALLSTITSGKEVIKHTEQGLTRTALPALGQDAGSVKWMRATMDSSKQVVTSHIAAMNAATAQVVTLTAGPTEEVDHTAVGAAITTITTNLPEMTKGVQMIAALMDDTQNGDRLLDATRKLCSAFSDLLKAAEPDTKEPRQNLLNAASRVGEASTSVLHTIGEETEEDKETQDILLSLAKAVANTTAALVLKAKNVASQCRDEQPLQNNIIAAATHCALATSQLVACAKVVAPTLHNPACREQLTSAARQVAQAVEKLVAACQQAPESAAPGVEQLTIAAQRVSEELERLLAHCDLDRRVQPTVMEQSVESVMSASERVADAADAPEMVRRARLLGQATARLIADIKTEAEKQPSESQRKLLAAAKLLADATARMVEAARLCASQPQDRDKQEALRRAAEELRFITVDYAQGQDIVGTQLARLSESARQAASSATQLITSAQNATQYNTNKYSQETLLSECEVLNEQIPRMAQAARTAQARPADPAANLDLITASETFLQPSGHVVQAARGVLPTVNDITAAKQLADTTHQFTTSCADLRSAVSRARISCKGVELDAAAEIIRSLQAELDEVEQAARDLELRPLPGQTAEWASGRLQSACRSAASATAQLVSSARRRESPGCSRAAADLASALRDFAPPLRATVATAPQQYQTRVIKSGRQVLYSSLTLVETVKHQLASSEEPDTSKIMSLAKNISEGMEEAIGAVPSYAELDAAIENIGQTLDILDMGEFPQTDKTYGELQTELNSAAVVLSNASSQVVDSVDTDRLPASAADFQASFDRLVAVCLEMAGHAEETESRTQMVSSLKTVTVNSSKLLSTAKSVSQDLTRPNAKNQLAAAARAVTESINHLVDVCTEAAPGQKECAAAIRNMESSRPLLSAPTQPISELGYFACLDAVVDQSKLLSEGMSGMASAVKKSETDKFSRSVATVATAVQGLVECTAQAAYLVAVSDETSVAGRAGLVDQAQFARAAAAIDHACRTLCDPNTDQHQVLSAATVVAKHTSALCNACRGASGRCAEPQSKRHFVQAAKDVANCTAALVKEIKALDADYCDANRARCAAATGPLQEAVRSLRQFADSPEFAAVPAKISPQARDNQEAILHCGRNIITESCAMVEAARALALSGTERAHWHALAHHSKAVSDTIKSLVANIREKAPGQRECAAALDTLNKQLRELDQVQLQAVGQELQPRQANTLQGYSEQMENSAAEMVERLEPLRVAARSEAENLGHAVVHLTSYAEPLVHGAAGAASNMTESRAQAALLQHTRTVLETLTLLLHAAKQAAGNPRATTAHGEVDAQASLARSALSELTAHVRELSTQRGATGPMLDSVARAVARLTEHRMSLIGSYDETDSFVDYQTRMVGAAKEIARLATDMTAKAATEPTRLVEVGNDMCGKYERLAADSVGASATTPNGDIANRIRLAAVELGEAVSELVRAGGHCRLSAIAQNQRAVADCARKVNEKVVNVLSALQAGSRGTQACIDAAATIATILGDLDTTILFASAGTLQSDKEGDTFSNHRENILKTAKTLVEDTKTLVGGAAGSQEQLAAAAQSAVSTIVQLCEVVKQGATSLSGAEPQVLVLHAARDAAAALRDLAAATAAASGKSVTHPDMHALKHAAKVMVTNVTSLLKTVKAVEDEHTRGTRALESTIEAISQEIEVLMSPAAPKAAASVEELVRCTRLMTAATARAVAASGQDQLTAAANLGRRTVLDMLAAAKGAAHSAETEELKMRTLETTRAAAEAYRSLLAALLSAPASRSQLPELSRRVAQAVADMLAVAELLKGSEWVDPADPTVIAEQELLGAAASIDAAARKLDALRPRVVKTQETDENMNFDEMILEAAKSIIAATSALVRAASAAQRELIDQGKVARRPTSSSDDGQWSEGLVSAARLVAAAAHALVEAANALVQGAASEERLISSARQVASSTAQLLVACKVKADPSSESTRRLQSAGAEVIRSTDNLVRAARDAIHCDDERSLVLNRRMVGGIAQEIDARTEVLRIEKELEEARGRLTAIRQAKYKLRDTSGASGDETDTDHPGYSSDASHTPTPHRFKAPSSSFANTTYSPNSTFNTTHNTTLNTTQNTTHSSQNISQHVSNLSQSTHGPPTSPGYHQNGYSRDEKIQSPSFSSFRPLDETPKQNYEGFTTRDKTRHDRTMRNNYETRLYDTPRPINEFYSQSSKTDEQRHYETSTNQFYKDQKYGYDAPKVPPMSPKFNAREMKFDEKPEPIYSTLKKPFDGVGQTFSEHQKSTEAIPGGTKQSEFTVKNESYQSYPKTEFFKTETRQETKLPFTTSTPAKSQTVDYSKTAKNQTDFVDYSKTTKTDFTDYSKTAKTDFTDYSKTAKTDFMDYSKTAKTDFVDYSKNMDMVKAVTPEYDRIASPYGKDVHSFGGPNFFEETTTEVKEIPNGTQKITKTTIYSSSPVNLTTTNTKYEPIKLEGIDELSKFDNDSRYSTLDSRFNTLESKMSSDTSRSFMRPSDFQTSDYQATTSVTKVKKPSDLVKEIDSMDKKFSKQSITSETIERKSIMTSSHKSESSSTVTKKFGNF